MTIEIFIIGLEETGASLSLALENSGASFSCTGYDPDPQVSRAARKRGDIDRIVFKPKKGIPAADLIILAVAEDLVREFLEILAPKMKTGALIIDTSPLKLGAISWAKELLREGCYYIGAVPIVNPDVLTETDIENAMPRADLFSGGLLALVIPANTPENIINLTYAIAAVIDTAPFFIDPEEIDAAIAAIEQLPAIMSMSLIRSTIKFPGWREIQRLAGRSWVQATLVGARYHPQELTESLKLNKDNVLRRLDEFRDELGTLRQLIASDDDESLKDYIEESSRAFYGWLKDRQEGNLAIPGVQAPSIPKSGLFDRLLGMKDPYKRKNEDR